MTDQLSIFTTTQPAPDEGLARMNAARAASAPADAKRHAIQQADVHADTQWREAAYAALRDVASTGQDFTADDVWEALKGTDATTHEPSALGPVFLRAARARLIVKTGRRVLSRSSRRHRDLTVWRVVQ